VVTMFLISLLYLDEAAFGLRSSAIMTSI